METLELEQQVELQVQQEPVIDVSRLLGAVALTGQEARLAQVANMTANVRDSRRHYFVR